MILTVNHTFCTFETKNMSQKTKVCKDELGLYVTAGGWIARPFYGTKFKEGDIIKTHHFGGSNVAGVTSVDKDGYNFKYNGIYERWCTTGIMADEYNKKTIKELKKNNDWYEKMLTAQKIIYGEMNKNFVP